MEKLKLVVTNWAKPAGVVGEDSCALLVHVFGIQLSFYSGKN